MTWKLQTAENRRYEPVFGGDCQDDLEIALS